MPCDERAYLSDVIDSCEAIEIRDTAENAGFSPSPFMVLSHGTLGYPLLCPSYNVVVPAERVTPQGDYGSGETCKDIVNPELRVAVVVRYNTMQLARPTEM